MPRGVRYRCSIRQFLNRPGHHGKATIIASVEDTRRLAKEELRYARSASIYLNVSDCDKNVTLTFDIDDADEQANALYKIDTLLAGLGKFRDALAAEITLFNAREEERLKQPSPKRRPML